MESKDSHKDENFEGQVNLKQLNRTIYQNGDKFTEPILALMFLFGVFIAFFFDTWLIAFGIGSLSMIAYYSSKRLLPHRNLYQYVFSGVSAIFAAQYIYQMHGMAEMHFWVFISSTILVIYQNWKLQLPLIILVILHHGTFAYLEYIGYEGVYFTQIDNMDLTRFIFHGALASAVCLVSGIWGYYLHRRSIYDRLQMMRLERMKEELERKALEIDSMNAVLRESYREIQHKNEELLTSEEELMASSEELKQINENLNRIVIERTDALLHQNNALMHHAHISAHKVRAPLARILGLVNLLQHDIPNESSVQELLQRLTFSASELDDTLRDARVRLDKAEFKDKSQY